MVEAKEANKYLFIWDKQGQVATFMQYKAQLLSLGPHMIKAQLSQITPQEVGEQIRKAFVYGMRNGENLCLDVDALSPDWSSFEQEGTFSAEQFFNFEEMKKEEVFMKYVRESENHGIGGLNPGFGYTRSPDFGMQIRSAATSEEQINGLIAKIPNFSTHFQCIIVE